MNKRRAIIVIALLIVIGLLALYISVSEPISFFFLSLSQKNENAFTSLNLPSSFALVAQTERKEEGDFVMTPENVVQVRTYKVSMNMAQAKEILLGRMRENEDKSIVVEGSAGLFGVSAGLFGVVGKYATHEEAFEVAKRHNDTSSESNDDFVFYDVKFGNLSDIRASMHPRRSSFASSTKFCTPGQLALNSNTYMTVIFSDTEDGARVEIDSDGKVVGFDSFGTFDRRFEREFCSTEPDESYVTIVMWAA